jgi:hypothetical protein
MFALYIEECQRNVFCCYTFEKKNIIYTPVNFCTLNLLIINGSKNPSPLKSYIIYDLSAIFRKNFGPE